MVETNPSNPSSNIASECADALYVAMLKLKNGKTEEGFARDFLPASVACDHAGMRWFKRILEGAVREVLEKHTHETSDDLVPLTRLQDVARRILASATDTSHAANQLIVHRQLIGELREAMSASPPPPEVTTPEHEQMVEFAGALEREVAQRAVAEVEAMTEGRTESFWAGVSMACEEITARLHEHWNAMPIGTCAHCQGAGVVSDVGDNFPWPCPNGCKPPETTPVQPSPGLLMSMALRMDHGLGCPGLYDSPAFAETAQPTHEQRLRDALTTARQLWEEVTGNGFYSPEKEADYVAMLPPTPTTDAAESSHCKVHAKPNAQCPECMS